MDVVLLFEPEQLKNLSVIAVESRFQKQFVVMAERWIVELVLEAVEVVDKEWVFLVESPGDEAADEMDGAGFDPDAEVAVKVAVVDVFFFLVVDFLQNILLEPAE